MFEGGIQKIISSKSKTFLAFCFCFIAGVAIFSWFDWKQNISFYFYISLFLLLLITIILWNKRAQRFLAVCLFFFVLGALRVLITIPDCSDANNLCSYNDKKITFI